MLWTDARAYLQRSEEAFAAALRQVELIGEIVRLVLHGGAVARDIIERSIACAVGAHAGKMTPTTYLRGSARRFRAWVANLRGGARTASIRGPNRRHPAPLLQYDYVYGQVVLELPYTEEDDERHSG